MTAEAAFTRTWPVGKYVATLSMSRPSNGKAQCVLIEWSPEMPQRLGESEIAEYVRGRNAALADMAAELGLRVALVEV